jgi:hypothetical protein
MSSKQEDDPNGPFVMAYDCINHMITSSGLEWFNCTDLPDSTPARQVMRLKAQAFLEQNKAELIEMGNKLHMDNNTIYPAFKQVVEHLFANGISWGRIIALYAFGGNLAVQYMVKERSDLVVPIVEWTAIYMRNNVEKWVVNNGGYDTFVQIFDSK